MSSQKPTLNDGVKTWIRASKKWGTYMTNLRFKSLVAKERKKGQR